jgi:hypothetical protein
MYTLINKTGIILYASHNPYIHNEENAQKYILIRTIKKFYLTQRGSSATGR